MPTTADFRNGMCLALDNELYWLVEFQHVKPGKGGAFVRTRLKNVKTGAILNRTFRAGERIEEVRLERRAMQYLYHTGDSYYFMDLRSYEQISLPKDLLADSLYYLKENMNVNILVAEEKPVGIELPFFVDLKVTKTDPGVKGDTASGGSKPATLETGVTIQVPLFINAGDLIKVDTRTGEYIERV